MYILYSICAYICRNNTDLTLRSGTSTACATVAGVVATFLQRYPNHTPDQLKYQLIGECTRNAINVLTRNGEKLPFGTIGAETDNTFAYTGKCSNSKAIINLIYVCITIYSKCINFDTICITLTMLHHYHKINKTTQGPKKARPSRKHKLVLIHTCE